jgi:hypothetical protein
MASLLDVSRLTSETPLCRALWDGRWTMGMPIGDTALFVIIPGKHVMFILLSFAKEMCSHSSSVATRNQGTRVALLRIRSLHISCASAHQSPYLSTDRSRGEKSGGELSQSHHATSFAPAKLRRMVARLLARLLFDLA